MIHSNNNKIFIRKNILFQSYHDCIAILLSYFRNTLIDLISNNKCIQNFAIWMNIDFLKFPNIIKGII